MISDSFLTAPKLSPVKPPSLVIVQVLNAISSVVCSAAAKSAAFAPSIKQMLSASAKLHRIKLILVGVSTDRSYP